MNNSIFDKFIIFISFFEIKLIGVIIPFGQILQHWLRGKNYLVYLRVRLVFRPKTIN